MREKKMNTDSGPEEATLPRGMSPHRIRSLIRKEMLQIVRDPSSIAIALVLPVFLILIFGYALSLDVKQAPLAIVLERPTPDAADLAAGFMRSGYLTGIVVTSMKEATELMIERKVDGILHLREDFGRGLSSGGAPVQVIVHGVDANRARIIQSYAAGAFSLWMARRSSNGNAQGSAGQVRVQSRMWFNEAVDSRYFLVPGLVVLIMTLTGALLTALVMAREWERGTLEALFVTPVRTGEILIGKTVPYFLLGMAGLLLTAAAGRFLFDVPLRGSFLVLLGGSALYLLVALAIGLFISSATRSQFIASQIALVATFLPALFLSGFLFDLASVPQAVRVVSYFLPARYYVSFLQTVFLAGDVWGVILPNCAAMVVMMAVFFKLTLRKTKKRLA
ncbi:MAG: ABC transporter permease [Desulfobacteraceae bacterium]|nr:ABC transporter permease [Desulfobacteraceae bacterium]